MENHFARNDEDHVELDRTGRATVVKLDKRITQADLRIVTGLVEPHFMAGYSGGRKVITLGVAHRNMYVVGIGKASAAIMKTVEDVLGSRIDHGLVITKYSHSVPLKYCQIREAGHPITDENGVMH